MEPHQRLVVIGASAGGVDALQRLAADLPSDFPAPILVVLHIGAHRIILPELLNARGPLTAVFATEGVTPQPGFIYVAPSDQHLLLVKDKLKLFKGAKENHARPAIDPLFRSAALCAGARVIGVVLTGMLDDGTAGLRAIQICGGTTIVQDPKDAVEPSMPLSALASMSVDHILSMNQMADHLNRLAQPFPHLLSVQAPETLQIEHAASLGEASIDQLEQVASPSALTCPDCGGALFELKEGIPVRYRCHTGHAFGLQSLLFAQGKLADEALWGALRALKEKEFILRRWAKHQTAMFPDAENSNLTEAQRLGMFAEQLQSLILETPSTTV